MELGSVLCIIMYFSKIANYSITAGNSGSGISCAEAKKNPIGTHFGMFWGGFWCKIHDVTESGWWVLTPEHLSDDGQEANDSTVTAKGDVSRPQVTLASPLSKDSKRSRSFPRISEASGRSRLLDIISENSFIEVQQLFQRSTTKVNGKDKPSTQNIVCWVLFVPYCWLDLLRLRSIQGDFSYFTVFL